MLMARLGATLAETWAEPLAQQHLCGCIWLRFGDRNLYERLAPLSKASGARLSCLSCPWVGLQLGWGPPYIWEDEPWPAGAKLPLGFIWVCVPPPVP